MIAASTENLHCFNRSKRTHYLQVAARLSAGAVESHDPAILARQVFRSNGAGNGCLCSDIVVVEIVKR